METTKIGTLSESERLLYSQFRKKINAEARSEEHTSELQSPKSI